jgi:hypothetical protein
MDEMFREQDGVGPRRSERQQQEPSAVFLKGSRRWGMRTPARARCGMRCFAPLARTPLRRRPRNIEPGPHS